MKEFDCAAHTTGYPAFGPCYTFVIVLEKIWRDPVWSKVIAAVILGAAGSLVYHFNLWQVWKRWIGFAWANLVATSPVPHWVLVLGVLVVLIAVGIIVGVVSKIPIPEDDPFSNLVPISPITPPAPNLQFLSTRRANIEVGLNYHFYEKEYPTEMVGVVACFRNEPVEGRRVLDAGHVTANIVYRNSEGREIGEGIVRACWLNEFDTVDFDVGQSHCVILVMKVNDRFLATFSRRHQTEYGIQFLPDQYVFNEPISTIELRLLGSRNDLLVPIIVFEFSILEGIPHAARSHS